MKLTQLGLTLLSLMPAYGACGIIVGNETDLSIQVRSVVDLYPFGVDTPDYTLFDIIFTDDVFVDYSASGAQPTRGIPAFVQSLSESRTAQNYTTMHHFGSQSVNISTAVNASVATYVIATFFGHGAREGQIYTSYQTFSDDLVFDGKQWKIYQRKLQVFGQAGNPDVIFG
ncbi:SnoaL-like domain-containing protein [Trichoderma simmonsii]|uniref:SnoaL-like domain-containing protein n=1 Tax=Trichoderma simmonsii TaxID=1491479 RepID=A0A8G0LMZ0_9HYPO|nr:SnoaL-like domain-containing protein [Trichoderma simmonsii]